MANQTLPAIFSCFLLIFSIQLLLLSLSSAQESGSPTSQSSQSPSLRSAGLIWVKICCLIIVFVATFLGGISPYFYKWNSSFLVLGTQFAGGVFLASALIHFLSDANKTFQERTDVAYPFAFMLAAAGYLLTMYGDCVIQWIFTRQASGGRVSVEKGDVTSISTLERSSEVSSTRTGEKDARRKRCCEEEEEESTNVELKISVRANASDDTCISCGQSGNCCKCADDFSKPGELRNIVKATLIPTSSFADSALLIIALCFHSVFEGIAIGVAETKLDAWKALWTVCLHKIFAAISMGIALLRMIPNRPFISTACYSLFFAVSSPVGIIIGILIDATTEGPVADWIYAISMGFASGIFIYIAINHILVRGYVPPCQVAVDAPFYKFVAVLTGAFVIAVVMIWDS